MDVHVANSKASASKGITPPLYVYEHVLRDARNIIKGAPFDEGEYSTLLADFEKKVKELKLPQKIKNKSYLKARSRPY